MYSQSVTESIVHPVIIEFNIIIQSFTTWKSFVMDLIDICQFNKPTNSYR